VQYKWVEGSGINNYAQSAHSWCAFTNKPEFTNGLQAIIEDLTNNNDKRAATIVKYILQ
jgi:hypothetical protein